MTTLCPRCFTANSMRVVGAYVYSATGAEDLPDFQITQFNLKTALVSQKLYQCQKCFAHIPETEMVQGKERVDKTIYWQTDVHGKRIPVVCPLCKNARHFIVKTLVLSEQDMPVEVMTENHLKESTAMAETNLRHTIPLVFVCAKEHCRGEIVVNEDSFKVAPLS